MNNIKINERIRQCKFSILLLLAIIALISAILYCNGNFIVYMLTYIFAFTLLSCHAFFSVSAKLDKAVQIVVYTLILAFQILFAILVVRPSAATGLNYDLCRLSGVCLVFVPFLVRQICFLQHQDSYIAPSIEEWSVLPYAQLMQEQAVISDKIKELKEAGKLLSKGQLWEILQDLPKHDSFSYINRGSLTSEYFDKASSSLNDPFIYLVVTCSKSASSELIGLFTKKSFNHVSISFDRDLYTIISYNGGEKLLPPGLNPELLRNLGGRDGASILVYRLPAACQQKRIMLNKVREINEEGSAYNLLGLVLKYSYKPNIMFCSQFVYALLKLSGLNYFKKKETHVKPTDFVEYDYYRKLEFVTEVTLNDPGVS